MIRDADAMMPWLPSSEGGRFDAMALSEDFPRSATAIAYTGNARSCSSGSKPFSIFSFVFALTRPFKN